MIGLIYKILNNI